MFGKKKKRLEISAPSNFEHRVHTGFDPREQKFTGLPQQWQSLLADTANRPKPMVDPSYITPIQLAPMKVHYNHTDSSNRDKSLSLPACCLPFSHLSLAVHPSVSPPLLPTHAVCELNYELFFFSPLLFIAVCAFSPSVNVCHLSVFVSYCFPLHLLHTFLRGKIENSPYHLATSHCLNVSIKSEMVIILLLIMML